MKVLVAYYREDPYSDNPFVYELSKCMRDQGINVFLGDAVYEFWNSTSSYDIIHIHWPEELLNWKAPTNSRLQKLEDRLIYWKSRGSVIVYHVHNLESHADRNYGLNSKFLYDLVDRYSDKKIHMGDRSYKMDFHRDKRVLIPHHTYDKLYSNFSSDILESRNALDIPPGRRVILCFGKFRTEEERSFVKRVMRKLGAEYYLLAPQFYPNLTESSKGIDRLKYLYYRYLRPNDRLVNPKKFISNESLPIYFDAASMLLSQRVNILNSGNLPLAYLFNIPVAALDKGNLPSFIDGLCASYSDQLAAKIDQYFHDAKVQNAVQECIDTYNSNNSTNAVVKKIINLYKSLVNESN